MADRHQISPETGDGSSQSVLTVNSPNLPPELRRQIIEHFMTPNDVYLIVPCHRRYNMDTPSSYEFRCSRREAQHRSWLSIFLVCKEFHTQATVNFFRHRILVFSPPWKALHFLRWHNWVWSHGSSPIQRIAFDYNDVRRRHCQQNCLQRHKVRFCHDLPAESMTTMRCLQTMFKLVDMLPNLVAVDVRVELRVRHKQIFHCIPSWLHIFLLETKTFFEWTGRPWAAQSHTLGDWTLPWFVGDKVKSELLAGWQMSGNHSCKTHVASFPPGATQYSTTYRCIGVRWRRVGYTDREYLPGVMTSAACEADILRQRRSYGDARFQHGSDSEDANYSWTAEDEEDYRSLGV